MGLIFFADQQLSISHRNQLSNYSDRKYENDFPQMVVIVREVPLFQGNRLVGEISFHLAWKRTGAHQGDVGLTISSATSVKSLKAGKH